MGPCDLNPGWSVSKRANPFLKTRQDKINCTIYKYLTLLALVRLYTEHKFTESIKYDYNNVI